MGQEISPVAAYFELIIFIIWSEIRVYDNLAIDFYIGFGKHV
jgi:hypothetical protein